MFGANSNAAFKGFGHSSAGSTTDYVIPIVSAPGLFTFPSSSPFCASSTPTGAPAAGASSCSSSSSSIRTATSSSSSPTALSPARSDGSDHKVSGDVVFPVSSSKHQTTTYRYEVTMSSSKVNIWLEAKCTKQQWETGDLELGDFVGPHQAIPMATLQDYVQCFCSCLAQGEGSNSQCIALVPPPSPKAKDNDDDLCLEFTLQLHAFTKIWSPRYRFVLYAVEVDPVVVLSAKVHDQEDEIATLRAQMDQLLCQPRGGTASTNLFFRAETRVLTMPDHYLEWGLETVSRTKLFAVQPGGRIRFLRAGVYVVRCTVKHASTAALSSPSASSLPSSAIACFAAAPPSAAAFTFAMAPPSDSPPRPKPTYGASNPPPTFVLEKNGKCVASCADAIDSHANGASLLTQYSHVQHILEMGANEDLSVKYTGNGAAKPESSIVIYKV
ncbi:hypothetical protein FI667_g9070, partial [Globisporangium splendens]